MPPRTNLFQEVVAIVERHKAPGTVITESDELIDRDTGEKREVDVTVRSMLDGAEVVMGIEAADRSRPADVPWVEQQIAKHCAVGTDQLVLVAARGFYAPAQRKAHAHGAVTITPKDLADDHEFAIIAKLTAAPATAEPALTGAVLVIDVPPRTTIDDERPAAYTSDDTAVDMDRIAQTIFDRHFHGFVIKAAEDLTHTHQRKLKVAEPPPAPLFARARVDATGELVSAPVHSVEILVTVDVQVHPEMQMIARLFDQTATLYGETMLGDDQAIFVTTEHDGGTQSTLRTRAPGKREPVDWTFTGLLDIEATE